MVVFLLGLSSLTSSCGTQSTSAPATTHSPRPAAPGSSPQPSSGPKIMPLAVIISSLDTYPTPPGYTVSLVDLTGKTIQTATAAQRSWSEIHFTNDGYGNPISLPQVSASDNRLYYLDGDATVRYLAPDGASGIAHTLPSSHLSHAAFAVSPDDQRIAVTVVDYPTVSAGSVHMRLYVEDL